MRVDKERLDENVNTVSIRFFVEQTWMIRHDEEIQLPR